MIRKYLEKIYLALLQHSKKNKNDFISFFLYPKSLKA